MSREEVVTDVARSDKGAREASSLLGRETEDEQLRSFFRQMMRIRVVEQTLLDLFSEGILRGTVHTCLGQEAVAAGVVGALDRHRDVIGSNHRGHGHYLAYCGDVEGLIAEIMGLPSGVCGGLGGSQHLHRDGFYSNGILGGMTAVLTGAALAEKQKKSGAVAVVFLGDGALGEGIVYESLNLASLWKLPLLFVVEQNGVAQSTPWQLEHAGALHRRAEPFDVPVIDVDGNDVLAVYSAARDAVAQLREGSGPRLLFARTYRLGPHSKGDDLRDPAEIASHWKREPLLLLREKLSEKWCSDTEIEMKTDVAAIVSNLKRQRSVT